MTTGSPETDPSQGWRTCEACGHWQRATSGAACSACQWPRLVVVGPGGVRAANALRVLVETEFRSDGSWLLSGVSTARLPDALDQAGLVQRLSQEGATSLSRTGNGAGGDSLPGLRQWEQFRDVARTVLADELNRLIRRNWPAPTAPSDAAVVVSIRTLLLDPDAAVSEAEIPNWLEIIPFHAAAAAAAAKLRDDAFEIDCSRTRIGFSAGGERIEAALTSPSELLVERCEVHSAPGSAGVRAIWKGSLTRVVRRNQRTAMPLVALSADAVRGLASDGGAPSNGEFRIFVRGRPSPIAAQLPSSELPAFASVADLLLDLGSTTTKWALRFEGRETVEHDQDTLSLTESWGVEAYRKADLISDATGERWCEWVARTLPALRRWVGREHNAYLRHVHVSLPTTDRFDVNRLGGQVRDGSPAPSSPTSAMTPVRFTYPKAQESCVDVMGSFDNWTAGIPMSLVNGRWEATVSLRAGERVLYRFRVDKKTWVSDPTNARRAPDEHGNSELDVLPEGGAKHLLRAASAEHLVASGRVVLVPEHELVAAHYLSVLRILQRAAIKYREGFTSHEARRRDQSARRASWKRELDEATAHNAKIKWWHFWKEEKAGPAGSEPTVVASITDPADWMDDLVNRPEQLDHVVLLDAGGLSLDISVLEKHTLVASLSHSDATCGGEAISARVDRGETGTRGTQRKATLGKYWTDNLELGQERSALLSDRSQRQYRDGTRQLHEQSLSRLFSALSSRWKNARHCTVLLTGGGSRNPHLAEYVRELAVTDGFEVTVVDAPFVQDLIRKARDFRPPLVDLDSPPIKRFEEAQLWSERRERQPLARYDKFAVVGGMCALEIGQAK
jgi:hypothetical protein